MDLRFVSKVGIAACAAGFAGGAAVGSAQDKVTFAIGSDFHAPDVPAGKENVQSFIDSAKAHDVDFIIELGDFCRLDSASKVYRDIWASFEGDSYHVIGNHDMDSCSPEEYVAGMGMPGRYYSFDRDGFHFIVLDGNNIYDGENYAHYSHANYYVDMKKREYMDPAQMEWLRKDLASTDKRCILFSHQSIDRCMNNGQYVREILENANREAGFKKVVLAFSGHNHSNYTTRINGITYMQVNSASYVWVGTDTQSDRRYPEEVNRRYTLMPRSITYDSPLYAIVTLTDTGASVKGTRASFLAPTPEEMGMPDNVEGFPLVSVIEDAEIAF